MPLSRSLSHSKLSFSKIRFIYKTDTHPSSRRSPGTMALREKAWGWTFCSTLTFGVHSLPVRCSQTKQSSVSSMHSTVRHLSRMERHMVCVGQMRQKALLSRKRAVSSHNFLSNWPLRKSWTQEWIEDGWNWHSLLQPLQQRHAEVMKKIKIKKLWKWAGCCLTANTKKS